MNNPPLAMELSDVAPIVRQGIATDFEYSTDLAACLPPIRTCGNTWHACDNGTWQIVDRSIFRPLAQGVLPSHIRSDRKANALLDDIEGRCQVKPDAFSGFYKFDARGDIILNCRNGVVRITPDGTITIEQPTPDHCFTLRIAADYIPDAEAPLFSRVLSEALPDAEDRQLYQLCAGNFLLPDCRHETALVGYGEAGRSKSTLAEPIAEALGREVVPRLTMSQICDPKSYHIPKLRFAAVNLGTELDAVELGDSAAFKALVSGESIEARPIFSAPFTMQTTCKLWFLANALPRFKHGTEAELRRTRFLRFDYLPQKKDVTLKRRLALERDGVLRWMIEGLKELLTLPEIPLGGKNSRNVHERFRVSNDPIGAFISLRCNVSAVSRVPKEHLRNAFSDFCERHSINATVNDWFFKNIYERWPQLMESRPTIGTSRVYVINGIELKP